MTPEPGSEADRRYLVISNQRVCKFKYPYLNCLLWCVIGPFCVYSFSKTLTLKDDTVHTVLLCLYVADPATPPPSDSVLGPSSPSRTACWLTDCNSLHHYLINIVNIKILSLNFSETTHCSFKGNCELLLSSDFSDKLLPHVVCDVWFKGRLSALTWCYLILI